jgi:hypothetical protein
VDFNPDLLAILVLKWALLVCVVLGSIHLVLLHVIPLKTILRRQRRQARTGRGQRGSQR